MVTLIRKMWVLHVFLLLYGIKVELKKKEANFSHFALTVNELDWTLVSSFQCIFGWFAFLFFLVCTEIQIGYSRRFVVLAKYKYRGRRVVQYRYKIVCCEKNVLFNDLKEMFSFKHLIYVCGKKARDEEKCTKKRLQTRFFIFYFAAYRTLITDITKYAGCKTFPRFNYKHSTFYTYFFLGSQKCRKVERK